MDFEYDIPSVHLRVQTPPSPVRTPSSPDWFPESPPVSLIVPLPAATPAPAVALDKVREEILLQRFRLRSLEQEIDDLRRQHAADQREMQELRERVATLERREEERSGKYNEAIDNNIEKPTMTKTEMPAEKENEAENGIENEPTRKAKKEEIVEAPSS
ncbi:hypothetical protein Tco_0935640 [Tanacetum coccineum]